MMTEQVVMVMKHEMDRIMYIIYFYKLHLLHLIFAELSDKFLVAPFSSGLFRVNDQAHQLTHQVLIPSRHL